MEFVVPRDLPRCSDWAHPQGPLADPKIDVFLATRFWSDHPKTSSWPALSLFESFAVNSTRTSVPESGSSAIVSLAAGRLAAADLAMRLGVSGKYSRSVAVRRIWDRSNPNARRRLPSTFINRA